ncbi:MAG: hypothetical protein R3C97_11370 [Geminicoccaceae bacterium]
MLMTLGFSEDAATRNADRLTSIHHHIRRTDPMANSDAVFINTPPGTLSYCWLNRRDTKFAKAGDEGLFRFTITFDLAQEKAKAFTST